MTNAPIYQSRLGDRPVGQTPLRNANTAASYGAGVGEALQSVGGAASRWQEVLDLRNKIEGDTRVRERTESYRARTRDVVAGFKQETGMNAVAQREGTTERLERVRQEEAAKIKNPREREEFLRATSDIAMGRADDITNQASAESRKAATDSLKATTSGYQEDALDHYNDPDKFEDNLAKAVASQAELAALTGVPQSVVDRAGEELVMETLTQRAVLMAASDPEAAMQYIESEDRLSAEKKQAVKDLLAPAVQGDRIDRWMSQFMKTGGGGGSFMDTTRSRESNGNPNAQNPNSTAGGLYQYIDETWDESVALAASAGALPPEYAGMSVSELRAAKMDPELQTAVMAFDEKRYEDVIRASGGEVTNQNKYLMHHFGMGAGGAILRTMQTNPGKAVADIYRENGWNWDAVVSANPGVSYNMTAGELMAYTGAHIGEGGGVQFDFAGAYSFAQTIEDPADRAAFVAQVEAREATEAKRRRAETGQVLDEASQRYLETGNGELSMGEQLKLGLDGTNTFREMVARNESGKLVTDMSTFSVLTQMANSPDPNVRRQFAEEGSIEPYMSRLSQQDYRAFTEQRALVRAELEGVAITDAQKEQNPALAVPVKPEHRTNIGRHLDRVGVKGGEKNAEKRALAEYQMETRLRQQMIDFYRAEKREPTEAEVDDMIYAQTLQIAPGGVFGSPAMMFQFDSLPDGAVAQPAIEYDSIPATARVEVTQRLATVLGRTPTPEEVAQAYVNSTLIKGQLAPVPLDTLEVPVEVFVYGNQLGIAEDELRMHWETYVNRVAAGEIDPNEYPFVPAPTGPQPR